MMVCVGCDTFPCLDVKHDRYILPEIAITPEKVSVILISEAAPDNRNDYLCDECMEKKAEYAWISHEMYSDQAV